jgi:CheY-like chemotaxis protein
MKPGLKVLLVDDDRADTLITRRLLARMEGMPCDVEEVDTYDAALERIRENAHDVCLLDYQLGVRNGLELLREAAEAGARLPMILLTGQGDREIDQRALEAGAADYLVKGEIDAALLERSIRYAVEHKRLVTELQAAVAHVKQLQGILPICSYCHKIRDDQNYWQRLEAYVAHHSEARFSHGICPDCRSGVVQRELDEFRQTRRGASPAPEGEPA